VVRISLGLGQIGREIVLGDVDQCIYTHSRTYLRHELGLCQTWHDLFELQASDDWSGSPWHSGDENESSEIKLQILGHRHRASADRGVFHIKTAGRIT
jgi:hypothetical protein